MVEIIKTPSKEEWGQWRHSPAGEWYFAWLQGYFQQLTEKLVLEGTIDTDSVESTALSTIKTLSKMNTLYEIGVTANYEYIREMLDNPVSDEEEENV